MNETTAGDNSMVVPRVLFNLGFEKNYSTEIRVSILAPQLLSFFIYQYLIVQLTLLWRKSLGTFVLKDLNISLIFQ